MSIVIKQNAIISENISEIGKEIKAFIESLDLDKQVATDDTIKYLKQTRADLNKRRDNVIAECNKVIIILKQPITELENKIKNDIKTVCLDADNILRDSIYKFEDFKKEERKTHLKAYFDELCECENIDFVKFEHVIYDVNLSTTDKKYREQIDSYIFRVKDDLALINVQDHCIEILAEYKIYRNVSRAIRTIHDRKLREKKEKEIKDATTNLTQITNAVSSNIEEKQTTIIESPQELFTATFEVKDTASQMLLLKNFLITNKFNYKQL
jgi:hypothetical protein